MDDNIAKIKDRLDIVDLISGYLKLNKAGVNYKANCPFHGEKTPSFYVSPTRQIWHCFGCAKGGDHFEFVQEIEGVEFPEALRVLAQRAGVELKNFDRSLQNNKTRLLEICELAAKFFEKQLWHSTTGQRAKDYLQKRGLKEETIRNFRLGYAPQLTDSLSRFLRDRGFRYQEIAEAGLAIAKDNRPHNSFDRFRSRIMFPIADLYGQVVGFTGRIFAQDSSSEIAKYVNTPQTLLYDKSRLLYGLDKAKTAIRQSDRCLVVEGNVDVILSHQAGVTHTVASSGTALTEPHLKILSRFTKNLHLCFDQDAAGVAAMERGISLALQHGFSLAAVKLDDPNCKDPADYVQKFGEKWRETANQTEPIFKFYLRNALQSFDPDTANGKKMITEKLLPLLKNIPNQTEQYHWLAELALQLKVKEELLIRQINDSAVLVSPISKAGHTSKEKVWENAPASRIEDHFLSLLVIKPYLAKMMSILPATEEDLWGGIKPVLLLFNRYLDEKSPQSIVDYLVSQGEERRMRWEELLLQGQELWTDFSDHDLEIEFLSVLNLWWRRKVSAKLADLEWTIKRAEKNHDPALKQLIGQFQATANRLNEVKII